jgi:hypothetical protein
MSHPLQNHPIVAALGVGGALMALNKVKYTRGTACVRLVEKTSDGYILVEMNDDRVFVADEESLQSLMGAYHSKTPVRYWINNFKRVYNVPRGSLGDVSLITRLSSR